MAIIEHRRRAKGVRQLPFPYDLIVANQLATCRAMGMMHQGFNEQTQ